MHVLVKRLFCVIGPDGVGYVVVPRMCPVKVHEGPGTYTLELPRGGLELSRDRMMGHLVNGDLQKILP